jgi:hypothetical protein
MPAPKKTKPSKSVPFYKRHWGSNEARYRTRLWHHFKRVIRFEKPRFWWAEAKWWKRIIVIIIAVVMAWAGVMYGIARWYIASQAGTPQQFGVTFIPSYAQYFGLDPQQTLNASINDLNVRRFRLVSYWNDIEPTPGNYDFSQLDWQFKQIEAVHGTITLAVGLRQPRWPECHEPDWAKDEPRDVWYPQLKEFMRRVVERYKDSPSLVSYQLENEFFLKAFGKCTDFDRQRLMDEFNYVKSLDPDHPVIIARSNNALGLPVGQPTPDEFGVSVYKRVWDQTITHRYFEYPFPAWFYGFLAGAGKIVTGKNLIIHELQAEPWIPDGFDLNTSSVEEQNKSMNAERLKSRFEYGRATGMKNVDMWGMEWWYWRKVKFHDDSLWNVARDEFIKTQNASTYK